MPTLTLLAQVHSQSQLDAVEKSLKNMLGCLEVEFNVNREVQYSWPQVSIDGNDEKIAVNLISSRIGLCPESLDAVAKFSSLKGYVCRPAPDDAGLLVDVGVFKPQQINVLLPLWKIQAQLADGKKIAHRKVVDLYALYTGTLLSVRLLAIDAGSAEGELSDNAQMRIQGWKDMGLDRLIATGVSDEDIEGVIERTHLQRDIVCVEHLGMFEHCVVCKLGTDAAGLIPRIGRLLKNSSLHVFSPRRVFAFFEEEPRIKPQPG